MSDVAIARCDGPIPVPSGARAVGTVATVEHDAQCPIASVILCAYGKRQYSERCLASLDAALGSRLGAEFELVLVDNASPDDTADLFATWADRARLVSLDPNRNFAGGANAGAAVARGRVLVFLNNDTEVGAGAIEALVAEALRPAVGAVGVRLTYPDGRIQHGGFGWRKSGRSHVPFHLFHYEDGALPTARASFDTRAVTGACVAVPRELFAAVGGFDEHYVNGYEDVDLCLRLRAAGTRVRYRGDVEIVHHEGVTAGATYHSEGNAERFAARWGRALEGDERLVAGVFGGAFVVPSGPVPDEPGGAPVKLVGPAAGLGGAAAEARALLRVLGTQGAARTPAPTWIGPALGGAEDATLLAAHRRAARPDAVTVHVPDAGAPAAAARSLVLRLATVPAERPAGAIAWAATPALAGELVSAGWPADAVVHVAPCGIDVDAGSGGAGIVALLPVDPALAGALLDALPRHGADARVVPVARTAEVVAEAALRAPQAEVLAPITDESAFAALCASADVVVAADPDDAFDRAALVAAATGAAVVIRPGGAAASVLAELAAIADPSDSGALAAAVASAQRAVCDRGPRAAAVAHACGPEAGARVRAMLGLAGPTGISGRPDPSDAGVMKHWERYGFPRVGAPADLPDPLGDITGDRSPAHAAGVRAFASGDATEARGHLIRALREGANPELLNDLAVVCHAAGETETAAALLRVCLLVASDHVAARENLRVLVDAERSELAA